MPIYEVMTRKHLTLVTLEENLEMAADIGIDATTSLDEAFAAALERHGPDAKVIVLPFARYQLPRERGAHGRRADPLPGGGSARTDAARRFRGSTRAARPPRLRVAGDQRLDDDRRAPAHVPGGRGGPLMRAPAVPCAHCGGAFHEPLTMAAKRHRRDPRAVIEAFRALETTAARRGEDRGRASRASA